MDGKKDMIQSWFYKGVDTNIREQGMSKNENSFRKK